MGVLVKMALGGQELNHPSLLLFSSPPRCNVVDVQYLASEGFLQFLDWFDDRGWYPLGRIIGGTIYPGLMFTAAVMYWVLNFFNITINIREVSRWRHACSLPPDFHRNLKDLVSWSNGSTAVGLLFVSRARWSQVCVFCAPIFAGNTAIASYLLTTEVRHRLLTDTDWPWRTHEAGHNAHACRTLTNFNILHC